MANGHRENGRLDDNSSIADIVPFYPIDPYHVVVAYTPRACGSDELGKTHAQTAVGSCRHLSYML